MNSIVNHREIEARSFSLVTVVAAILLGVAATWFTSIISLLWLLVVIMTVRGFIKNKPERIWYCVAASPVLEVWARMIKAPLLPYELGKYYLLAAILLLFLLRMRRHKERSHHSPGYWIIAAIIPGLIVNSVLFDMDQWVFNLLGVVELATLLILVSFERWSIERFCRTLQYALIPVVPMVVYLTLSASDFSNITFDLGSNSAASGGFASNQVSTTIGASIVLVVVLQLLKRPLFSLQLLNVGLLGFLIFRGFLTFSRGGMMVAGISVIIALLPSIFASVRSFGRFVLISTGFVLVSVLAFMKVNSITGNLLLLRYKGATYQTVAGINKADLDVVSSGRSSIAFADLMIFKDNFVFGVGPGISKTLRSKYGYDNITAHTEFTRLLSEHGIGGLLVVIVMIIFPLWWLSKQRVSVWRGIVAALFALAILTTFHAAMRTNTTIVMYVLAAMPVFYYSNKKSERAKENFIHRQ